LEDRRPRLRFPDDGPVEGGVLRVTDLFCVSRFRSIGLTARHLSEAATAWLNLLFAPADGLPEV